jgi:hypothetical protein
MPHVKRPLGRPRSRSDNNIRMDLRVVGCEDLRWVGRWYDSNSSKIMILFALKCRFLLNRVEDEIFENRKRFPRM